MIKEMKKSSPDIDKSIFRAAENVELDSIVSYVQDKKRYNRYKKRD